MQDSQSAQSPIEYPPLIIELTHFEHCKVCKTAYLAIHQFELVPDGLPLNVGPGHKKVDDSTFISTYVCMCMRVCVCMCERERECLEYAYDCASLCA